MSKRLALFGTLIPVVGLLFGFPSAPAGVADAVSAALGHDGNARPPLSTNTTLSPYWSSKVQRWESLIVQEAQRREVDPDFLASLVWMESRGDATAVGPAGAVGLMQIMPREAGFSWRPSEDDLLDPSANLYWGTRTLATVIRQGHGDVFSALAAYNGGWDRTMLRGPRMFATTILRDYARAVASREGLEGAWSAFFAVQDAALHGPIWVSDSDREDVYFYGDGNVTPEGGSLIPDIAPTAALANCYDEESGAVFSVGVWVYSVEQQAWITAGAEPALEARIQSMVTSPSMMAGSLRPGNAAAAQLTAAANTASPEVVAAAPTEAPAPVVPAPTVEVAPAQVVEPEAPQTSVSTMAGASDEVAPTVASNVACDGGPLQVDAWPLVRVNTAEGWKAQIYAEGRGGNCSYTYAWNVESDVKAVGVPGPVSFEVTSSRRASVIVGTVVVTSGGETQRVALYIHPPDD